MMNKLEHTIRIGIRDLTVLITFKDRKGWTLGDMLADALLCINKADTLSANDIISIETKGDHDRENN